MDSIRQFIRRLNWRYVILGVIVWWLVMLIAYSILSLRVNHLKNRLKDSGVALTSEFANLASLPLLEKNSQSIHKLLTEAANRSGVIYVSVVDHRNKVVAFTGTGHLMPDISATARTDAKVSIREGGFASHAKIVNFVSDITYAGTKIGEIFIGLSTPEAIQTRKIFTIFAVVSGLLLLVLIILFRYQSIRESVVKILNFGHSTAEIDAGAKRTPVVCPLCGTRNQLSATIFRQSNLDHFLTSRTWTQKLNIHSVADNPAKEAQLLTKSDDLSWLKRRIILRCTEIIKKLTA